MLNHMRGLQKRFTPTPDHTEELAKIEQIFNELKPKLECNGARHRFHPWPPRPAASPAESPG